MNNTDFLIQDKALVDERLRVLLRPADTPYRLVAEAMEYSVMLGGKRIRPCLVLEACRACGGDTETALILGCALEMIHTYSLIHDDLPCMDDDDMRRGQPSCHIRYGYANALLAGDALLTKAFETVASASELTADTVCSAVAILAESAGINGMIGGQVMDLANEGKEIPPDTLRLLNRLKTGKLLTAAVRLGALSAHADEKTTAMLVRYADALGTAFQIRDDILDIVSDSKTLGKPVGSDAGNDKHTYAATVGVEAAEAEVKRLTDEACDAISSLGKSADNLILLAQSLAERNY